MSGGNTLSDGLIVGESSAMAEVRYLIRAVAPTSASVLVTGPSDRASAAYVAVNCGAIPRDLLESELFGHEKGSFTGAVSQRRGRFEDAHNGSLFLDEIGDMPHDMQVKLLRVLEERAVQRVGGRGEIAVDTRIISATHRNLDEAIGQQRFREDLFYRLSVFPIDLPSLGERREDVPLLVKHFLREDKSGLAFSPGAMDRLTAHPWPGNIRELRNVIDRAMILFSGQTVSAEQVEIILHRRARPSNAERIALWEATEQSAPAPAEMTGPAAPAAPDDAPLGEGPVDLRKMMADLEYRYISEALKVSEGTVADAARLLSLQRTTLIEKMRKHGLAKAA
jgi:sigma-54 dependent transcriptional regulator, flagellar regulatory protein